ncbi:flagellar hook capping FlgD N-terminal domain-containing protein [Pelagimonas varians]|uniref:Basal-body rod modification protein FlgD n=1 Tax=Pelagimonas varians TaxID=696760 RepID=A0A238KKK0_9RHOB|nr:flagellar hook capping FlgD N-terminal domain-containing protein [Pelagimonas varians]PYG29603.1 flagellar basal-body rod modification protein FlgD [Pelagimonas varians]SMX42642.1 Basal-body rod modification protein FlgD [Pelagimonas varians]
MTDTAAIQPVVSSTSSAGTTTTNSAATSSATVSSDFETFLKMMTVQVQNQDPMNPMDSTEYATQLATFSSVEQQVLTNDLLKEMGAMLGGNALQQFGSWVGMDALARTPAQFTGEPVVFRPEYAVGAETANLLVRNSSGDVVQRLSIPVGQEEAIWAGVDDQNNIYPDGSYRFEIESYKGEELLETNLAAVYNRVDEVRNEGSEVMVRLASGAELTTSQVDGLRSAGT